MKKIPTVTVTVTIRADMYSQVVKYDRTWLEVSQRDLTISKRGIACLKRLWHNKGWNTENTCNMLMCIAYSFH